MNQTTLFRFLVLASIAVAVLGSLVDSIVPGLLPTPLEDAYETYLATEEPSMSLALTLGGFTIVLLLGTLVGTVGLLLFKPWGRPLSLWTSVLAMFSYPFIGPVLCSGWAAMLTETSMMLWGAALAMAYFADIKVRFETGFANTVIES